MFSIALAIFVAIACSHMHGLCSPVWQTVHQTKAGHYTHIEKNSATSPNIFMYPYSEPNTRSQK